MAVTQQFNTSTSLGRLTLNILLSFAQFERELIGERTRDKMSAARRKGKWVGGCPVLGYDVDPGGGRLAVNEEEAGRVRAIFALFEKHGSISLTLTEIERRDWRLKSWTRKNGRYGKSQSEVAEFLDVTFQQVQKYENGKNRIPLDRLVSLADFLEVPLQQFIDPSESDSEFQSLATNSATKSSIRSWKRGGHSRTARCAPHCSISSNVWPISNVDVAINGHGMAIVPHTAQQRFYHRFVAQKVVPLGGESSCTVS